MKAIKGGIGARVLFCGHAGYFVADIYEIADACIVRAPGPVLPGMLNREFLELATHHLVDSPEAGFWRPDLGVFVVPAGQVKTLAVNNRKRIKNGRERTDRNR